MRGGEEAVQGEERCVCVCPLYVALPLIWPVNAVCGSVVSEL